MLVHYVDISDNELKHCIISDSDYYMVPDEVKVISKGAFDPMKVSKRAFGNEIDEIDLENIRFNWDNYCMIETIGIGSNVEEIAQDAFTDLPSLEAFDVNPQCKCAKSCDGILYNSDMTVLMKCPEAKGGDIVVPDSVKIIDIGAFACQKSESKKIRIYLPDSVTTIRQEAFMYSDASEIHIPESVKHFGC